MQTLEQKIPAPPQEQTKVQSEKRDIKKGPSDAVKGFEELMLAIQRAREETKELAKKDPEKAATQERDLEMHAAGLWLNVRMAQASKERLGDTPQEVGKNAEKIYEFAEKLGKQPIDAYVRYVEKMLPEYMEGFAAIERQLADKKLSLLGAAEQRMTLSERLNDFLERKIFLVQEMLDSKEMRKMPKEEHDGLVARVQAVKEKALDLSRAADAPIEKKQEKAEKK